MDEVQELRRAITDLQQRVRSLEHSRDMWRQRSRNLREELSAIRQAVRS